MFFISFSNFAYYPRKRTIDLPSSVIVLLAYIFYTLGMPMKRVFWGNVIAEVDADAAIDLQKKVAVEYGGVSDRV